jgi:OmcA/MtrC family decaheme c-type cytochrome
VAPFKLLKNRWINLGAASLFAIALAGCGGGGGGGDAGTAATGGTGGGTSGGGAAVNVAPPTGTPIDAAALTPTDFAALAPTGAVTGVSIASPPVVTFQITDANNRGIKGLGFTSQNSTAAKPGLSNLAFALAKLVPGTNGSPSKWVSYIVTTSPTTTAGEAPTRPSTDNIGTLVDNGDGTYKYTFYRDITKVKDLVAAATLTAPNVAADLGDLTYDAKLLHRLVIQVGGNARGTGTNTANAADSGVAAVPMGKPVNLVFDWYPDTGKVVDAADTDQREIVKVSACFECHGKFQFHGGNRQDTRFCVVCHSDQRKFGRTEATTTATGYSGSTNRINGRAAGDLPAFIHRLHMGKELTKTGYNYGGILFNEVTYPQPITNCTKCHNGSANAANKTPQGDNYKNVPSILACGACHDGIDFATGKGTRLNGDTMGHIGGRQADDSKCALCHDSVTIPTYHVTVDPTGANGRGGYPLNTADNVPTQGYPSGQGPSIPLAAQMNLPAGVYKIGFEIKQVTVASNKATVVYRILKDGQPVTFNATGMLISNVDGTPDIYVTYATTQDGIVSPADWNASKSAHIIDIRDKKNGSSQTGPDGSGYYTATLGATLPADAKMVTGVLGINYNGFVQLNHPDYPKGIRLREPAFAMKLADGFDPRRSIVSNDKCNACHAQLGVAPSFHSGARNNGEGCATGGCHDANKATGHVGAANSFGGGWSVAIKNMVHAIHGSAKREQAFTYEATADNLNGFQEVTYPGVLKNCETCHVAGSYDFSGARNSAALPNLLWTSDALGNMTNDATTNPTGIKPIGLSPWVTTQGSGQVDYTADNLVSSPIASSCFGCHDTSLAVQHMETNGGTLVRRFSSVSSLGAASRPTSKNSSGALVGGPAIGVASTMTFTKNEQCMLCHASGKVADIKAMHAK